MTIMVSPHLLAAAREAAKEMGSARSVEIPEYPGIFVKRQVEEDFIPLASFQVEGNTFYLGHGSL